MKEKSFVDVRIGIDDNNKIKCAIGFSSDEGKMYFEGDMQHQGIFNC